MYLLNLLTQLVTSQLLLNQQFIFCTFLRITSELKEIVYYNKRPISLLFHALSHKTIKSYGKFYCQCPLIVLTWKKRIFNLLPPPPFLLCCYLESRNINFHSIGNVYLFLKTMTSFCSVLGFRKS